MLWNREFFSLSLYLTHKPCCPSCFFFLAYQIRCEKRTVPFSASSLQPLLQRKNNTKHNHVYWEQNITKRNETRINGNNKQSTFHIPAEAEQRLLSGERWRVRIYLPNIHDARLPLLVGRTYLNFSTQLHNSASARHTYYEERLK